MAQRSSFVCRLAWLPLLALSLLASACASKIPQANPMPVGSVVRAPSGFIDFCMREPGACSEISEATGAIGVVSKAEHVALTAERWRQLNAINSDVNETVRPVTDMQQYGKSEYWEIAAGSGDCEDYALLKRKKLLQLGWPAESLTMATARNRFGELHAVLIVGTDRGDFVMDNASNFVTAWSAAPYQWVSRQDPVTPMTWRRAGVGDNTTLTAALP